MKESDKKYKIGIRLENKSQESRVPLVPYDVNDLINHEHNGNLEIVVEKSRKKLEIKDGKYLRPRCFTDEEYSNVGAIISEDLSDCQVIIGIKEVPLDSFEYGKTYIYFSHTYKAQEYNRKMFVEMRKKKCTLIDYELIVENEAEFKFKEARALLDNKLAPASKFTRTVYFGKHAGIVGAINTLWVLGKKQEEEGEKTPFSSLKQAMEYRNTTTTTADINDHFEGINDYKLAKKALQEINENIKSDSENQYIPIIIGITGKSSNPHKGLGNTAKGAKEVIDILEHTEITPKQLLDTNTFDKNKIYVVYFDRNQTTETEFAKYLKKLTVVLNCMKWEKGDERPMSVKNIKNIFDTEPKKVLVIGDVTCDPGGSLEPCQDVYSDKSYYIYEPKKDTSNVGDWMIDEKRERLFADTCKQNFVSGNGPVIMAVTNLPCELPKEASRKFSFMLRNYIMEIAKVDGSADNFNVLNVYRPIKRAILLYKGKLTPDYNYLKTKYRKTIFIAGAGKSSPWLIKYLTEKSEDNIWHIIIGDKNIDDAMNRANGNQNCQGVKFDVLNPSDVDAYVEIADVVISLLPAELNLNEKKISPHVIIAKSCLKHKKSLLTASYISDEMEELNDEAKENKVLLLNEMGLDPGIDHMSLMNELGKIRENNEIISLKSYCGGLIAPESNNNPWGYKFTWNVKNVIDAGKRKDGDINKATAKYQKNNCEITKNYGELFLNHHTINHSDIDFDGYANRDSIKYKSIYNIENIETIFRGTLRYKGFCKGWDALIKLGLTGDDEHKLNQSSITLKELVGKLNPLINPVSKKNIANSLSVDENSDIIEKLDWIGLFSNEETINISNCKTVADILQSLLEIKWKLEPKDKDQVFMVNEIIYRNSNGEVKTVLSSLSVKGEINTFTAMAKTVGLPLGITTKLILDDKIELAGVHRPSSKEFYEPVLVELEEYGIKFNREEK